MKSILRVIIPALAFCALATSCNHGSKVQNLGQWDFSLDSLSWEQVQVPHSYNAIDGHSIRYYRGKGYYRKELQLNAKEASKPVYLCFEGAAQKADIYVNGVKAASHKGGYAAFYVDLSGKVAAGNNTITVVCDNSADMTLAPVDSDFNKNGGLHNPVNLLLLDRQHFAAGKFGKKRMHVTTAEFSAEDAVIEMSTSVCNADSKEAGLKVKLSVFDADGKEVGCCISHVTVAANSSANVNAHLEIQDVHAWNGVYDPYLYTAKIQLMDGLQELDCASTKFGVRSIKMDADLGFFLNGQPYSLRGTSIHQDMDQRATALTRQDYINDYQIVKELGCNFVRLAHYPHNDIAFDLCDSLGLIVQTEIPWVNVCGVNAKPEYFQNLHEQMQEMIVNLYNHPSIAFWGMWNELAGWGNRPNLQGRLDTDKVIETTESLYDLAKSLDPSRYVGLTDCELLSAEGYTGLKTDYVSENRYSGWYYGKFEDLTADMQGIKDKGFVTNISEYGAGVNPYCHTWDPEQINNKDNSRHYEEWGNLFHESHLQQISQMPWLNFTSIWILFDFPVAARQEGYVDCADGVNYIVNEDRKYMNDKGLVTRDRKTKKDAFYLYKAKWNNIEETVHIAGKRLEAVPEGFAYTVKVYSNAQALSLYRGDTLVQTLENSGEVSGVIWQFSPVVLADGGETLTVVSADGTKDSITLKTFSK